MSRPTGCIVEYNTKKTLQWNNGLKILKPRAVDLMLTVSQKLQHMPLALIQITQKVYI